MSTARFVGGPLDGRTILNTPGDIFSDDGVYRFDQRFQNYVWFEYSDTVHIRPWNDETTTREGI